MEHKPTSTEQSVEQDSEKRQQGMQRLATHVMFECEMREADERLISREDALTRVRALYPLITGEVAS